MMEELKNKKEIGITLIALVVTIIVLLIIAAVTIVELTGNGLLSRTKLAKEKEMKAEASQKMTLKITSCQIKTYAEKHHMATLEDLLEALDPRVDDEMEYAEAESQRIGDTEEIVAPLDSLFAKLKAYPFEFEINSDLQLASIDDMKVASKTTDDIKALQEQNTTITKSIVSII